MPSMIEAANIRDIAARHAYVFDNGLCSPDFFDVEKRMASEEFGLLRERICKSDSVLEIGCFTGLNLIGLLRTGHVGTVYGIDFVRGALDWCESQPEGRNIHLMCGTFPSDVMRTFTRDTIVCFDVLEHQLNVGLFLDGVLRLMHPGGQALFLVPVEAHYNDCGHVAWFPDAGCLRNVLEYFFEVDELFELKTTKKLFAACRRRA